MDRLSFQGMSIPTPVTIDKKCPIHKNVFMQKITLPTGNAQTVCPECVNEEIIEYDREMVEHRLQKIKEISTTGLFERESDLNPELKEATFKTFQTDGIYEKRMKSFGEQIATYYERGGSGNTIFYGGSGVGKSHIAISILKQLNKFHQDFRIEKSVLFISVEALMSRVKDTFKNKESRYTEDNMLKLLTEVDYLVLDDLGTESKMSKKIDDANNWNQQFLFKVLDMRDTTIITSNLSESEMHKLYNDKLVSRIFKNVGQKIFEVPAHVTSKRRLSKNPNIEFEFNFDFNETDGSENEQVIIPSLQGNSGGVDEKFNSLSYGDSSGTQIVDVDKVEQIEEKSVKEYPSLYDIPQTDSRMTVENIRRGIELPEPWKQREGEDEHEHFDRVDKQMPVEYWFKSDTPNFDFLKNETTEEISQDKTSNSQEEMVEVNPDEWNGMTVVPKSWLRLEGETEEEWLNRLSDPSMWEER